MRLGITARLFLAVFATGVLVAVVMTAAGRAGFRMEFSRYARAVETRRVEALAEALGEIHEAEGGWAVLTDRPGRWQTYLRRQARMLEMRHAGPPPGMPMHREGAGHLGQRLALLDPAGKLLAGNPRLPADAPSIDIVDGGEIVGRLAWLPFERPVEDVDLKFHAAHWRTLLIAAVAAVALAALAAWALSRVFLEPARRLGAATHRLAAGDYSTRVQVASSDEFGQLARDFNVLATSLERNEAARREFTADVAHELRTPLAIIRAELDALQDGVRPLTPETVRSIQSEVAALSQLVGDLYDLALSDAGALSYHKSRLDLRILLSEIADGFRERFAAAGLALETRGLDGPPLWVHADPGRLSQLFTNLLQNCLRYTDAPGNVQVACEGGADEIRVVFADSAPGVPDPALPRLFERLYRVEGSRSRAHGGAGLGLAIARNIAEAHGGTIAAASSALGGLAITVTLPRLRAGRGES